MVRKTIKVISAPVLALFLMPVDSFAQSASADSVYSFAAESSAAGFAPQVYYNFGFFASIFFVIFLSGLLYFLKTKWDAKEK